MKKIKNVLLLAVSVLFLCTAMVSCNEKADYISSRQIVKKVNEQLKAKAANEYFTTIKVGIYEVDDVSRCTLKKLEAAGLITYSEQRYCWWEKQYVTKKETHYVHHYSWWDSWDEPVTQTVTRVEYTNPDYLIATVKLTPKGERLVVEEVPQPQDDVDKDMEQPEYDPAAYPEGAADCSWNFRSVPNPFLQPKETSGSNEPVMMPDDEVKADDDDYSPVTPSSDYRSSSPAKKDEVERIEESQYIAYQEVVKTMTEEVVTLRAFRYKAAKARNIQIINDGEITATAEVIFEVYDVTDAGRVINELVDGIKHLDDIELIYYFDRGWVIEED